MRILEVGDRKLQSYDPEEGVWWEQRLGRNQNHFWAWNFLEPVSSGLGLGVGLNAGRDDGR